MNHEAVYRTAPATPGLLKRDQVIAAQAYNCHFCTGLHVDNIVVGSPMQDTQPLQLSQPTLLAADCSICMVLICLFINMTTHYPLRWCPCAPSDRAHQHVHPMPEDDPQVFEYIVRINLIIQTTFNQTIQQTDSNQTCIQAIIIPVMDRHYKSKNSSPRTKSQIN